MRVCRSLDQDIPVWKDEHGKPTTGEQLTWEHILIILRGVTRIGVETYLATHKIDTGSALPVCQPCSTCVSTLLHLCQLCSNCMSTLLHLYVNPAPPVCQPCSTCMSTLLHLYVNPAPPVCQTCSTLYVNPAPPCMSTLLHLYVNPAPPCMSTLLHLVCQACSTCMSLYVNPASLVFEEPLCMQTAHIGINLYTFNCCFSQHLF